MPDAPSPSALSSAVGASVISAPEVTLILPPRPLVSAPTLTRPPTDALPAATIEMTPLLLTIAPPSTSPVALTVAWKRWRCVSSSAVTCVPFAPVNVTFWPSSVMPFWALIWPEMMIEPSAEIGISPRISLLAAISLIVPSAPMTDSRN